MVDIVHGLPLDSNLVQVTLFHFEDELRENAAAVVDALKVQAGLRVLMLTGDNTTTAERVAKTVGIDEFHARLKPEDKLNQVKRLSQEKSNAPIPLSSLCKQCHRLSTGDDVPVGTISQRVPIFESEVSKYLKHVLFFQILPRQGCHLNP